MSLVRSIIRCPLPSPPHSNLNDYNGLAAAQSAFRVGRVPSTVTQMIYKFYRAERRRRGGYGRLFSKACTAFRSGNSWEYVPATT